MIYLYIRLYFRKMISSFTAVVEMMFDGTTAEPEIIYTEEGSLDNSTAASTYTSIPNNVDNEVSPPAFDWAYVRSHPVYVNMYRMHTSKYYVMMPLSLICNLFCLAVLGRRMFKSTAYFYMANVAVWDLQTILWRTVQRYALKHGAVMGDGGCSVLLFLVEISPLMAVWLVILLTADRVVAVWWPLGYREICTLRRALLAYAILFVLVAIASCNNLWMVEGFPGRGYHCFYIAEHVGPAKMFTWLRVVLLVFIPTVMMAALNAILAIKVRQQMAVLRGSKNTKSKSSTVEAHVTMMAFAISISFFFLSVPYFAMTIAINVWDYMKNSNSFLTYVWLWEMSMLLIDFNHSINIIFYFLSGKKFRGDALAFVTCGRLRATPSTASKSSKTTDSVLPSVSMAVIKSEQPQNSPKITTPL